MATPTPDRNSVPPRRMRTGSRALRQGFFRKGCTRVPQTSVRGTMTRFESIQRYGPGFKCSSNSSKGFLLCFAAFSRSTSKGVPSSKEASSQ